MELDLFEEPEPTVLEYARLHGLCEDYTSEVLLLHGIWPPSDERIDSDLRDPASALPFTNPAHELVKERLAVSKEAAFLLKAVHILQEVPEVEQTSDERRRILDLKKELPLLRTDTELDLLRFGNTDVPSLTNLSIPLEPVDEEKDEGLSWPARYLAYPAQCDERAKGEKLAISKEVLVYLQDAIRIGLTSEEIESIKAQDGSCKRDTAFLPLSPPLLPLTPPMTPYIPSSPGNYLGVLSDSADSTAAEAKMLQKHIMGEDALTFEMDAHNPLLLEMITTVHSSPDIDQPKKMGAKRKAEELKIEGPLTPPILSESPARKMKKVTFSEIREIHQYALELPSLYENGDDVLSPEDDFSGFYKDAEDANWDVEHEMLSEADTTKRVDVPHIVTTLPIAPWDEFKRGNREQDSDGAELHVQMKLMLQIKRNHVKAMELWRGLSKLDRELPIAPFPAPSTPITIEEKLHGEENLNKMLVEMTVGDTVTSSAGIWGRDTLRLLEDEEEDDEEEELEPADWPEQRDVDALIRKRKREIEEEVAYEIPRRGETQDGRSRAICEVLHSHHWSSRAPVKQSVAQDRTSALEHPHSSELIPPLRAPSVSDGSLMFGGRFSATSAMKNFMAMHGMVSKPRKADTNEATVIDRHEASSKVSCVRSGDQATELNATITHDGKAHILPLPLPRLPSVPQDLPPCSFIISSTLLQRRSLSKQIEKLYMDADFVSRDLELSRPVPREADLLLSPSTGLIVTTLQQVKQQPLPGQHDRSKVKERVAALQCRYERLVVMIGEGLSQGMEDDHSHRPVDSRDKDSITEFELFASHMEGEVIVNYVPGGDQALARSIVVEMAKYGLSHGSKDIGDIKPLPDETNWELFLRRAGLNPFAAQVILALLKNNVDYPLPSSSPPVSSGSLSNTVSTFGLQTFLMMSADERIQSFQAVLGGSRILRRVNALLDQEWISATHGFRI